MNWCTLIHRLVRVYHSHLLMNKKNSNSSQDSIYLKGRTVVKLCSNVKATPNYDPKLIIVLRRGTM